jgi:hypothetical protein
MLLPIPKPKSLSDLPTPPIPPELIPTPRVLGACTCLAGGRLELAVILKRTYTFTHGTRAVLSEAQQPLELENVAHDPLPSGLKGSFKAVPEIVGYRSGTDIIVRAHARPASAVSSASVGVTVGDRTHAADVLGDRVVDVVQGKLVFSPPKLFESMPLRWELAYGGDDAAHFAWLSAQASSHLTPVQRRKLSAVADIANRGVPPLIYPRNRVGLGYCINYPGQQVAGRALPNIEFPTDRLTPERLVCPSPEHWPQQPVPACFDFMDVFTYPRTAMMALPPAARGEPDSFAEVRSGQVPRGFARGNILLSEKEQIPGLIHPDLSRCAPIGLRFDFLRGDETIRLSGMDPRHPDLDVPLPRQRVQFSIPVQDRFVEAYGELAQIFVDVDKGVLTLIWVARTPLPRALMPGDDLDVLERTRWRMLGDTASPDELSLRSTSSAVGRRAAL